MNFDTPLFWLSTKEASATSVAERRDKLVLAQQAVDQRHAPERDALSPHRRLHDLIEMIEAQRSRRRELAYADRREPRRPVEPGKASAFVFDMQQDVSGEIFGAFERPLAARGQLRAANRNQALAEKAP